MAFNNHYAHKIFEKYEDVQEEILKQGNITEIQNKHTGEMLMFIQHKNKTFISNNLDINIIFVFIYKYMTIYTNAQYIRSNFESDVK